MEITTRQINKAIRNGTDNSEVRHAAVVTIAEDVIAQIVSRKYNGRHGTYFSGTYFSGEGGGKKCEVCAIGSAIVSELLVSKKYKLDEIGISNIGATGFSTNSCSSGKSNVFTQTELTALEDAFEGTIAENLKNSEGDLYCNLFDDDDGADNFSGDKGLLILFSMLIQEKGNVRKVIKRLGPGKSVSIKKIMKVIEKVVNDYNLKVTEGTEACNILKELKKDTLQQIVEFENWSSNGGGDEEDEDWFNNDDDDDN